MNEIIIVFSLFMLGVVGFSYIELFSLLKGYSYFEKVPFYFAIGGAVVSFQMFLMSYFSFEWELLHILAPHLFMFCLAVFKSKFKLQTLRFKFSSFELLLLLAILMLLTFVAFESVLRPLSAWDGWAIWVTKARMFYLDGAVNPKPYHILSENYPFIINLSLVYIFKFLTSFNDKSVLLYFFAFYALSALALFNSIRKYSTKLIALLFTFLFVSTQNIMRHGGRFEAGYADLAQGFYILLGCLLFLEFRKRSNVKNLILLELILVSCSFIKEEGLVFAIILNLLLVTKLLIARQAGYLAGLLLFVIPQFFWQYFKFKNNLSYSLYDPLFFHFQRVFEIVPLILKEMLNVKNWNLLWITFLFSLTLAFIGERKKYGVILFLIVAQLIGYVLIFVVSPHEPGKHVVGVMDRLLLHLAPAAVLLCAFIFSDLTKASEGRQPLKRT